MTTIPLPLPQAPSVGSVFITAAEFERLYSHQRVELVRGVVQELPMPSPKHGYLCATIARLLSNFILENHLGRVMTNDSFVVIAGHPETVRGADVSYYSYERLPQGPLPEGLLTVSPNLVVEVRSPSDLWTDVFGKVSDYLRSNVQVVIVLDAASLSASVYRSDVLQEIFKQGETLTVPDLLPGFQVPVEQLFS